MNRWTMIAIICASAAITLILAWLANPPKPQKIAWCSAGQQAVLTGFGKDVHGDYLATYGCEKIAPSRAKAVAKK